MQQHSPDLVDHDVVVDLEYLLHHRLPLHLGSDEKRQLRAVSKAVRFLVDSSVTAVDMFGRGPEELAVALARFPGVMVLKAVCFPDSIPVLSSAPLARLHTLVLSEVSTLHATMRHASMLGYRGNAQLTVPTARVTLLVHVQERAGECGLPALSSTAAAGLRELHWSCAYGSTVCIDAVLSYTQLQKLRLCGGIISGDDLAVLGGCIKEISLAGCSIQDLALSQLGGCAQLEKLSLRASDVSSLGHLESVGASLCDLDISGCDRLLNLRGLQSCTQLKSLAMGGCALLDDISPLSSCALRSLDVTGCTYLEDLRPLSACRQLRELTMTECKHVDDMSPLSFCSQLESLRMDHCFRVSCLQPLSVCSNLTSLNISYGASVSCLQPLASCSQLRDLQMSVCFKVKSLAPLTACASLLTACVGFCKFVIRVASPDAPH